MINKEIINEKLWEVIRVHYQKECYTDCLKDALLYIIQLVQEKSESEDLDGEKLINSVFSEKNPKLLINNNQTQTEKDEQRGFGYILRGFVCAIRNPISHKNTFKFSKEEADSILLFINNYIIPRLDDSKDFGYVDDWFDFIFVSNKNDSRRYSDALLNNIPKKEKYILMIEIVNELDKIDSGKYKYFINALLHSLTKKEQSDIILLLNQKLIKVKDDDYLKMYFNHFEPLMWNKLDNLVKVRIEEMIYNSINKGKIEKHPYYNEEECNDVGVIGTWSTKWINEFSNKNEILKLIFQKLRYKKEARYILTYFDEIVCEIGFIEKNEKSIISELDKGNEEIYEIISKYEIYRELDGDKELSDKLQEKYNSFKAQEEATEELPF